MHRCQALKVQHGALPEGAWPPSGLPISAMHACQALTVQHGPPPQGARPPGPPQRPLALEQVLQTQKPLLPLRPVGAGAVVEHLGHVLGLAQVVGDAPVPGAVGALGAHAGGVAVGVVIRIHPVGLVSPPHRLLLPDPRGLGKKRRAT